MSPFLEMAHADCLLLFSSFVFCETLLAGALFFATGILWLASHYTDATRQCLGQIFLFFLADTVLLR